ncbi:MAG: hypothetical protein M1831_005913 [Alyxoria varia]|nr:MAG: hypothetical protein M1831_005913 [Alyxoria varia]
MVLALRGSEVVDQPHVDYGGHGGNFLCWNGEIWKHNEHPVHGNDTKHIFPHLCDATSSDAERAHISTHAAVVQAIRSIKGPFAFVFWDEANSHLYFGRDCLGRRSLLCKSDETSLQISSVSDGSEGWFELDANQVYVCELSPRYSEVATSRSNLLGDLPVSVSAYEIFHGESEVSLNKIIPSQTPQEYSVTHQATANLEHQLRKSMKLRVPRKLPDTDKYRPPPGSSAVAVLFSGGLDCTILARLIHEYLPSDQAVDLVNVAFENPRVQSASAHSLATLNNDTHDKPRSAYESCPDRITARSSVTELREICSSRSWNLVEIDVPYSETESHSAEVKSLIKPHNTEMDLSIAYALYFASRGFGSVRSSETGELEAYTSPARVLFSGLGADELFGGYGRHATAYSRAGHQGLMEELQLDMSRLGKRNLGRDDRVISHWGREARYPYLDEDFVRFSTRLPIWEKCGFGFAQDERYGQDLEPGKLALRLLARNLGLEKAAREKKRAIQFGARTARMEPGKGRKAKGTDVVE